MDKKPLLEVRNLFFAYEEKTVLKNINISVYPGDKIAVMGSNGAGKSTFFLNLNGVLKPDKGEIYLDGRVIKKSESKRLHRKIGFVFQEADNQIIAGNVRAEISFGPMNLGLDRKEVVNRVDSAVAYLDLEELQERAPHYLSGGEKKRVSIADILAMEPEILLFDEPMSALDPVNSDKVEGILERLHEEGNTLLIATHDVDFAYRFADRILVFAQGEVIADGSPHKIFSDFSVMERAHLRKPSMLSVWETLIEKQVVSSKGAYPVTPEEFQRMITNKNERGESLP